MTSLSPPAKVLLLLLALFLALPWGLAAVPRRAAPSRAVVEAPATAAYLTAWIGGWMRSLWGTEGANIDPNGLATAHPSTGPTGAKIDPTGHAAANAGTNIDPNL